MRKLVTTVVIACVCFILSVACFIVGNVVKIHNPPEALYTNIIRPEYDEGTASVFVRGKLINNTDQTLSNIKVTFTCYNYGRTKESVHSFDIAEIKAGEYLDIDESMSTIVDNLPFHLEGLDIYFVADGVNSTAIDCYRTDKPLNFLNGIGAILIMTDMVLVLLFIKQKEDYEKTM